MKRQFVIVLKRRDIRAIGGGTRVGQDAEEERGGNMGIRAFTVVSLRRNM